MEGKEVRFGITNSALFATVTTDASCGAINGWHDLHALGRNGASGQHHAERSYIRRGRLRNVRHVDFVVDFLTGDQTEGLWDSASGSIIILRAQLASLRKFAGTLLHESAHAKTGYEDVSRELRMN